MMQARATTMQQRVRSLRRYAQLSRYELGSMISMNSTRRCRSDCSNTAPRTLKHGYRGYATQVGFGQPTHETRPHLLKAGELTPGITSLEYFIRRNALADRMADGSVAILIGAEIKYRSGVVFYEFHQNPDFFYFSGFNEPKAIIAIEKNSDGCTFHMFVEPKNEQIELWEGPRTGLQGAMDVFNADTATDISNYKATLDKMINRASVVYMDGIKPSGRPTIQKSPSAYEVTIAELLKHHKKYLGVLPLAPISQSLRAIKSKAELDVMIKAGTISGHAFNEAYRERFTKEADLYAYLEYIFRIGGCEKVAYVPVVAGGKNALGIHYTRNDDMLNPDELVLVDAGGQYGGYCADISRTWPVSGKFTDAQKDLYQCVLNVQTECIKLATPEQSLQSIHDASVRLFATELRNIGFNVSLSDINNILYPHYIGHHLGLDVHDCPSVSRREKLNNGNVITIEPGIYVPPDDDKFPKHFHGIGIRIEDNVFIQDDNPIVISSTALKEIADIENATP